jgi:CubicO group peptidase (beta-lactamase class C family)
MPSTAFRENILTVMPIPISFTCNKPTALHISADKDLKSSSMMLRPKKLICDGADTYLWIEVCLTISDYPVLPDDLNDGADGSRILPLTIVDDDYSTGDLPIWLPGPWSGFGLGFGIVRNTEHVNTLTSPHQGPSSWSVGSYSWGGAFCTFPWADPREKLIGIMMTQVGPYGHLNIRQEYVNLVNQAIID